MEINGDVEGALISGKLCRPAEIQAGGEIRDRAERRGCTLLGMLVIGDENDLDSDGCRLLSQFDGVAQYFCRR